LKQGVRLEVELFDRLQVVEGGFGLLAADLGVEVEGEPVLLARLSVALRIQARRASE
jgi:hypothetical protein